ncbi:MAG TPA: bifunctional riboflavin kinase/FAD synthetase [Anaerolineales bacterium]|nr:bifunctional riboflavin kinase/FAD synthetase [Anaerolineales bacterium]
MRHYPDLEDVHLENTWLTIGTFDGVHRGHQEIVHKLAAGAHANGTLAVVLTFYPHPAIVLGRRTEPFYLTNPEERAHLLAQHGADVVITYPFNREVAATSAGDFVQQLKDHLDMVHLLVGHDFALGHNREGNVAHLRTIAETLGFTVESFPAFEMEGVPVSSSRIRAALAAGDIEQASRLLGRPYQVNGVVVPGDGRGRLIGVPTANLELWAERAIPQAGVYVCRAWLDEKPRGAVTNVGVRPTFETGPVPPRVETHLLDYAGDLYGKNLNLDFLSRLRDEQRFPSVEDLVAQIRIDKTRARQYLDSRLSEL